MISTQARETGRLGAAAVARRPGYIPPLGTSKSRNLKS